ncbi:hypothetical protein [Paenibacillus glycanilyticus]|uniref:Type II secretion system protein GspF domain-containing protein n=1 Tax=Paenibacillus glycanilyticus TaxID=126569 RepID=A0ABQ6G5Z1_9BACL|nr:hypothetical protein [Paenibacillus glycanilyticus]GLX66389.1 hypothetical protein MU1_07330 [Paenibacillus glycanilyticus]
MEFFLRLFIIAGQFLFSFLGVYMILQSMPRRRPRWFHLDALNWRNNELPDKWMRLLRLSRDQDSYAERAALLAGCGVTADAAWYLAARRVVLVFLPLAAALYTALSIRQGAWLVYSVLLSAFVILNWDLPWLRSFRRFRSQRITKEIYAMSNQLLYLSESSLHIHTKLTRCIPFTRTLRGDLERLLAEWYHDAEQALRRFKHRVGTDDGMSFVETIDSLRLHESQEYYKLLRERIQDYKEKIELAKESRKESTSYFLFVIAGIPILYTFQIFIYPWVQEGRKLFESLG